MRYLREYLAKNALSSFDQYNIEYSLPEAVMSDDIKTFPIVTYQAASRYQLLAYFKLAWKLLFAFYKNLGNDYVLRTNVQLETVYPEMVYEDTVYIYHVRLAWIPK